MIQQMLAIWFLVPLPFLNLAWTSGNPQFMYYWSLAWRILSITLLACEMSAIVWSFEHSLALLSMAQPIRARPRFPHSLSLPSESFHKPLILFDQRADRMKTIITKLTKLITWIIALSNSVKLWAVPCRATQNRWVMVEISDKTWSLEKGMVNHFSILSLRTPWTVWKGKKIWHWKMNSLGQ